MRIVHFIQVSLTPAFDWGSAADWVVAATAVAGVFLGLQQLRKLAASGNDQVDIARAQMMLEIDARFESLDMQESRLLIRNLRNFCDEAARKELRAGASDEDLVNVAARIFSEKMTGLREQVKTAERIIPGDPHMISEIDTQQGEMYMTYMRLPYWMETVAMLTRVGLILEDDVLRLYDAVFIGTLRCFEQHIKDRAQSGPQRNPEWLENALWLKQRAENAEKLLRARKEKEKEPKRPGFLARRRGA